MNEGERHLRLTLAGETDESGADVVRVIAEAGGAALRREGFCGSGAGATHSRTVGVQAVEALVADIDAAMTRATRWGDPDQGSAHVVARSGELLFDLVWPLEIKALIRKLNADLSVVLAPDAPPWLAELPFELMHDGAGFLGERFALGRTRWAEAKGRQASRTDPAGTGEPGSSGRALVICDPRGDLIGAYHEGLAVRDELDALGYTVDLRSTEVTALDVLRLLRDYELVHFAGHGERPAGQRGGPARGWWMRDEVVTGAMLEEIVGGRPLPRLVFSNACRSLAEGSRLAERFMAGGVEHIIGTTREVPDEVACAFALAFYEALRLPVSVGEAARRARRALAERYGRDSLYGGAWVLYGPPGAYAGPRRRPEERHAAAPARAVLEVGLPLRGAVAAAREPAEASHAADIGPTRAQATLAMIGALALLAMLVALVVAAVQGGGGSSGHLGPEVVRGRDGTAILRAHPVEHRQVQPLPGPAR